MHGSYRIAPLFVVLALAGATLSFAGEPAQAAKPVSEIPASFTHETQSFDYVRRIEMIPMRDGVKLNTVILIPRGAKRAPILLTRTPYNAAERNMERYSAHLATVPGESDVVDELVLNEGYIRVIQDERGKHHSKGDFWRKQQPQGTSLNQPNLNNST